MDVHLSKERDFKNYLHYLSHPWPVMWRNFLAGTFQAMGFLFGSAVLITVISFILTKVLGEVPFFSDFAQALNLWLQATLHAKQ